MSRSVPFAEGRVLLRKPTARDAREHAALVRSSRVLYRGKISPPSTGARYARYLRRARRTDFDASFVCLRETSALVGVFNLSQIFYGSFRSAYLGYYVGAPYAGQGLMSEGLELVLRRAFKTLRLHRVEANIQPSNAPSRLLVRSAGFRLEGMSARYLKISGRWRDHERWAITVEDWRGRSGLTPRTVPAFNR